MIKKYSKLVLIAICAFFISMAPTFAKDFTKEDMAEHLAMLEEEEGKIIDSFYLIGEYAFTSRHTTITQDIMLSARSINVINKDGKINTDAIFGEMTIHKYKFTRDDDDNPILTFEEKTVGTTAEPKVMKVKYIDYVFIPEDSKASLEPADADAYNEIKNNLGIDFENDATVNATTSKKGLVLTGDMFANDTIGEDVFAKEDLTGYYYAFVVKVENIQDDTIVKIEGTKTETLTKKDFNADGEAVVLIPLHPELDKDKRVINVKVDLDGESNPEYGYTKYTVDYTGVTFKAVVDVDAVIEAVADSVSNDKINAGLDVATKTLSVEQLAVTESLSNTTGKALEETIKEALATDGVESVKITYNGKDYVVTEADVESKVAEIMTAVAGKDYNKAIQNDVIGKKITMTVELEDGNITTVTPDGETSVEYTIEFTGTKALPTEATVIVDSKNEAYTDAVKEFLKNLKYDELNTSSLKLEDGKLTGSILINREVGESFSSIKEDITGYYFTYVLELKENVTDDTTVTLPGNNGTKVVGKDSFDTEKAIVVMAALNPDKENKVIEIIVDLDGDGKKYLPTTYTIDYSEVKFLDEEAYFELAAKNTDKFSSYKSAFSISAEAKSGESAVVSVDGIYDTKTKVAKETLVAPDDETGEIVTMYSYSMEKDGFNYFYYSLDETNWFYQKQAIDPNEPSGELFGSIVDLFKGYKSIERVASTEAGTILFKIVMPKDSQNTEDMSDIVTDGTVSVIENDLEVYVTLKEDSLSKIEIDLLTAFGEEVSQNFNEMSFLSTKEKYEGTVTIPNEIIKNAEFVEIPEQPEQ